MNSKFKINPSVFITVFSNPLFALFSSFIIYSILGYWDKDIFISSPFAYFNYLADAFLHGQLYFRIIPPSTHDLIPFQGNYYAYWPPFPAILFMPLVMLFGVNFSDIFVTIILASVNVALIPILLKKARAKGFLSISNWDIGMLTLFFGFGTTHLIIAPLGRVWFTAQIIAILALILTYIAIFAFDNDLAFLLTGLGISAALLTRNHLIAAGIFPAWYLIKRHYSQGFKKLFKYCLIAMTPVVITLILIGLYNYFRFGSPLDNGINYHLMSQNFLEDFSKYGVFSFHYLSENFYYQYIFYPLPFTEESKMGGSLFLLSPLFFLIFWAFWKEIKNLDVWCLLLTISVVNIPILLLMGTGWVTFGPRYTLDFIVPMVLLTAMGLKNVPKWITLSLVVISILQYLVGYYFISMVM